MVGTLIKTQVNNGFYIGIIKNHHYDYDDGEIRIDVVWNDNDDTMETFHDCEDIYETCIYHFYDNGRWWRVDTNFYMFKQVLEGKCK